MTNINNPEVNRIRALISQGRGGEVSDEEVKAALAAIRADRQAEKPKAASRKKKEQPVADLDALFGDL